MGECESRKKRETEKSRRKIFTRNYHPFNRTFPLFYSELFLHRLHVVKQVDALQEGEDLERRPPGSRRPAVLRPPPTLRSPPGEKTGRLSSPSSTQFHSLTGVLSFISVPASSGPSGRYRETVDNLGVIPGPLNKWYSVKERTEFRSRTTGHTTPFPRISVPYPRVVPSKSRTSGVLSLVVKKEGG